MGERRDNKEHRKGKPATFGAFARLADSAAQLLNHRAKQARDAAALAIGSALRGGILLAGAALAAVLGLQAIAAAVIAAIGEALPIWGAALIAGLALLAIAGVAAMIGAHRLISAAAALKLHDAEVEGSRRTESESPARTGV